MYLDGEIRIFDQEDIFEDAVYELVNGQNQMECTTNELKTTLLPEAPLLLESIRNEYYIVSPDEKKEVTPALIINMSSVRVLTRA